LRRSHGRMKAERAYSPLRRGTDQA
jgi:hypothetical protein